LSDNISDYFSYSENKFTESLKILKQNGFRFEFELYTNSFLENFLPLYNNVISAKRNPGIKPIKEIVDEKLKMNTPTYTLSVFQNDIFIGGYIFFQYKDYLLNSFSSLLKEIPLKVKVGNIAFVCNYLIYKFAYFDLGLKKYSHGTDRNLYGLNSDVGLCIFKLRCGSKPYIFQRGDLNQIHIKEEFNWDGKTDIILMEGSKFNEPIKDIKIFTSLKDSDFKNKFGIF
jgi:hypothetical protein